MGDVIQSVFLNVFHFHFSLQALIKPRRFVICSSVVSFSSISRGNPSHEPLCRPAPVPRHSFLTASLNKHPAIGILQPAEHAITTELQGIAIVTSQTVYSCGWSAQRFIRPASTLPARQRLHPIFYRMWSWFGGSSAQARKDAPKNAILALRQQLDMLQKREKHLESQIAEQDALARKHVSTNKTGESTTEK